MVMTFSSSVSARRSRVFASAASSLAKWSVARLLIEEQRGVRRAVVMVAHDPDGGAESLKASLYELNERQDGPLFKIKNDPRVTRVGKVIRKYRLDELAQFINILKGDMSLVGPRPHQPDEVARYQKHHKKVLAIKAGATGLAQVSGSSDLPFDEEVMLDSFYIENWSLGMDFKIIFRTVFKMLHDHSAV